MKNIKLMARVIDSKFAEVTVLEQTHREEEFGPIMVNSISAFEHGEIALISGGEPEFVVTNGSFYESWTGKPFILFVRGFYGKSDRVSVRVPLEVWPKIKEAVKAYNGWGASQ